LALPFHLAVLTHEISEDFARALTPTCTAGAGMADLLAPYVLDGAEPETAGRRNLPTMRLCDAIIRSSPTGQTVDLAEVAALGQD
jgi:predicted dehydrogenase